MIKRNRISISGWKAKLIMLCLLVTVTCPGLLSAEDDPLLEEPEIAPLVPEDPDVQVAPEFVSVDWTCEAKAVKPKSSTGSSGDGLVGEIENVKEKMDGDSRDETHMVKATLQIPIAAAVKKGGEYWRLSFITQMPIFDIPDEIHEQKKIWQ